VTTGGTGHDDVPFHLISAQHRSLTAAQDDGQYLRDARRAGAHRTSPQR
jgi:hypothetical protein